MSLDPLILVENEITVNSRYDNWKDLTGERYHFPNQYRNKFGEGKKFIYYRGSRRLHQGRGTPEYFGTGTIGTVFQDPETQEETPRTQRRWFAEIVDYRSFPAPVPAKIAGSYLEKIPQNFWGVGVRVLPTETFQRIIELAGLHGDEQEYSLKSVKPADRFVIDDGTELMVPQMRRVNFGSPRQFRRSRRSKLIGDLAEEIIFNQLNASLSPDLLPSLRWVAKEAELPGWDIQFGKGQKITAIEVKGTTGAKFPTIEVTANEWNAAATLRHRYWLYLVADCMTSRPRIQRIQDPFGSVSRGKHLLEPLIWRFSL